MTLTLEELEGLLKSREDEHLEFKEAKYRYDFELLVKYCAALANERGGKMIFGVTDRRPRRVVGSQAFADLERTKAALIDRLHLRIEAEVFPHPDGQVVVFSIPSRPNGMPIQYKGAYWMRGGEDLVPMTPDMLKRIFEEGGPDYSAQVCADAVFSDLDPAAIQVFRAMWQRNTGNSSLQAMSDGQLLQDAELVVDGAVTYAALILMGSRRALGTHLAQAEIVFEYRSNGAAGPAQQRLEYRQGFLANQDELWKTINLRNEDQHFQQGMVMLRVPTFNEAVIREALLNAVSHRDYRLAGSVFVRQYARRIEIVSPGGFPSGITPENILIRQSPRNRRIAEVFAKCGLVERSGQGMNRMYEESIKESKRTPDFASSDDYQVSVTLHGEVQDVRFLQFIERIGQEQLAAFTTDDFLVIDLIHREQPIPEVLKPRLLELADRGVIEKLGRGRGTRYILSGRFYDFIGKRGDYTRRRGLDRETNKALLLMHIGKHQADGSRMADLRQVLPALSVFQVRRLLGELREEGKVAPRGRTKSALWYLANPSV